MMQTEKIADGINKVREDLGELEGHIPNWQQYAGSLEGSQKYRSIAKRIVLCAQRLEALVKENTFSR
jgi:hypothetical protein